MNIVDCNEFKEDHFLNYLLGNTIHEEFVADLKLVIMRRDLTGSQSMRMLLTMCQFLRA